jgi:hypothetical protein
MLGLNPQPKSLMERSGFAAQLHTFPVSTPPCAMVPHSSPITERIDWLFGLAQRHAQEYASPEAWLARQRHLANHPTAIVVMKCMDGRINIPIATQHA